MDEAEQDQYEARLKELFDSFDSTGTGSLGQEELTDLCHVLHLEEVAPALQQTLLQGNLLGRVHFDQFKEALILILSRTLSNEEHFQEPGQDPRARDAQPSLQGGESLAALLEPCSSLAADPRVSFIQGMPCNQSITQEPFLFSPQHWKTRGSEEYEAEGQLRFWNPDDLNASPGASPSPDWIEEKLQEVCEHLGITRDGHLNRKKLVSICEQHGLQAAAGEVLEEVLHNLEQDGTMSIEDFFYGLFRNGKSLTPSASTPYRQLKRHLSMQSFDESGRRTTTPSAMPSTIGFSLFSSLDDGMGYGCVEEVLDCWHQEGIENSQEILKALDFSLDGKVNLTELTLALENELLITKNGVHQAALASFKTEIRHLLERFDQVAREKEKLRSDLEKAEKLKSLMASENELRREREQILQQANKQRLELEQEIEKLKTEENYTRDRLGLALKENSRLENELLETGEKLAECESLASKLQRNLENVLAEKFGDLDPTSAEFFLQEERLAQMRSESCRTRLMSCTQSCRMGLSLTKVSHYEKQLDETKAHWEKEQEDLRQKFAEEMNAMEQQITGLKNQIAELQGEAAALREQQEKLSRKHSEEKNKLQLRFDEEKANLQELLRQEHEAEVRARVEQLSEGFRQEREELTQKSAWVQEEMRAAVQSLQQEKGQLEQGFQEQLRRLAELHLLEKEQLQQELLRKHQQELEEERKKMASDYNRRASHAQTQFSVDTQTLVNKYEETLQSLEGRYQRELQELAEQQREEKSQWEFERDEIAQEAAEAHEQLKESLASEKAVCCALSQEKDLLEKHFKEEVNKLVCEREQLEKELRELRNAAQEQEEKMMEKINQLQNDHEKELKEKEEQISTVEQNGKLVREKLERLDSEYKREKEELNSKLLALESLNRDICERAETEKAEMGLEVSDLRGKIQKLQWETRSFAALQSHYRLLESEYAKARSQLAACPGAAALGDDGDVLQSLQKVHEQAVKENVRMAAQILRLQHRLRAAEQELHPPSPSCSQPGSEPEEMEPSFEGLPSDCQDVAVGADFSVQVELERAEELSEDSLLLDHTPGAANSDLKSVIAQLWKKMEELEDRSMAQAELLSLQEEIQVENEDLKAEVMQLIERNGVLEENLRRLRRLCCEQKESETESVKFEDENGEFLAEKLREENAVLKNEVTLLNEEGSASSLKLRELSGSREEMRKEKVAVQKMVDNLKKQVADLKTRNQQLDSENTELSQRNSKNQADVQDLNQQLARVLKQKEREEGKCTLEEWEKERLLLKEELENSKIEVQHLSSNMVSSLEMDLSKMKLPRCPDLAELQNEVASLITKNEKLQKEKEALSEELNRCIEKVAQVSCLESAVGSLEQEQKSWEQQSQALKAQLSLSQDKVQSLSEALQSSNLQMSRLKSDLQLTQQEKESLEQEVMALHKQLQGTSEKNLVLEAAVPPSGLQEQQGPIPWGEQELLRQDNERLQREVQSTKTDLAHCREKIRQLESTILSLKHQKHQSQAGIVKAMEQEKLSLKRECEQLQKELSSANRKISQMNSLERELESSSENEGLRKKQVKLDDQLMEMENQTAKKKFVSVLEARLTLPSSFLKHVPSNFLSDICAQVKALVGILPKAAVKVLLEMDHQNLGVLGQPRPPSSLSVVLTKFDVLDLSLKHNVEKKNLKTYNFDLFHKSKHLLDEASLTLYRWLHVFYQMGAMRLKILCN
ncbi:hypothetical protein EK904_008678 [Melospiza melodia maxima]|nr:hypothetical protein EK904_008678 [Melospiza melodia maxima]